MRYVVERANDYSDGKPCDNSEQGEYWYLDQRTFQTKEEYDSRALNESPWMSYGRNHTTWHGGIQRELARTAWWIDAEPAEILSLMAKYGGGSFSLDHNGIPKIKLGNRDF